MSGRFRLTRDEKGCLSATPIDAEIEYESHLDCTAIPIPNKAALEGDPLPWTGGLLFGPAGVGKSYQALRELLTGLRAGALSKFISIPRYIEEMRDVATAASHDTRHFLLRNVAQARYAVLDDLGAEKLTEFAAEALYLLIDGRWSKGLPTVVTSNLSPEDIAAVHGDRILSRIQAFGPLRRSSGRDRRGDRTSQADGRRPVEGSP